MWRGSLTEVYCSCAWQGKKAIAILITQGKKPKGAGGDDASASDSEGSVSGSSRHSQGGGDSGSDHEGSVAGQGPKTTVSLIYMNGILEEKC